jgi:excisionase family DNA binding protein
VPCKAHPVNVPDLPPGEESGHSPRWESDKAHPGRPVPAGPVQCVGACSRTVKARGPHVSPSTGAGLDCPGGTGSGSLFLSDVHTNVHASDCEPLIRGFSQCRTWPGFVFDPGNDSLWTFAWTPMWTSKAHDAPMHTTASSTAQYTASLPRSSASATKDGGRATGRDPDESGGTFLFSSPEPGMPKIPALLDSERLVLSVSEVGALLGLSRSFAYELVARGELPVIRLGRRIVVPKVALMELLGTASSGS